MGIITGIILSAIAIGATLALIKLHFEVRQKIGENRKNDIVLRLQKYEEGEDAHGAGSPSHLPESPLNSISGSGSLSPAMVFKF